MTEDLLSTSDVARMVGVHAETVREWIRQGKLPAVALPGHKRVRRKDLDRLLQPKKIAVA